MWNKIKSLFSKNTESASYVSMRNLVDEYDKVHFTIDTCPSCGYKFESIPKRKKKCTECNAYTFVRTNYNLNKKVLLSEKGIGQLEANRNQIAFLRKWIGVLGEYGISEKDYYKQYETTCDEKGFDLAHSDFIWSMFNKLTSKIKEPSRLKMLYYNMAWFLNEEGKDFFSVLKESKKWELLDYKKSQHISKVEILAANNSCENCKNHEGEIFTINKALEIMPLPRKDCSNHDNFCRCSYLAVIE